MKRFFLLLLAFLCFLIPVGCGDPDSGQKPSEPTVPSEPEVPEKPAYQNAYLDKKDGLKILAIGNSFTYVSTQYLWEVLDERKSGAALHRRHVDQPACGEFFHQRLLFLRL